MRVPGRRHWTEEVSPFTVEAVTSGPQTGSEAWLPIDGAPYQASVQPVSNAELIRHGLETSVPTYWVRYRGPALRVGDGIEYAGRRWRVASASVGENLDVQLMVRLAEGRP